MEIILEVDTNDYNEHGEEFWDPNYVAPWTLWGLKLATFQDWDTAGQTGFWTIDGETFCGTRYRCEVNFRNELLLRCLVAKIKEVCGDRFISISIGGKIIKFTDDDLMCMPPEVIETLKEN